MNLVLVKQFGAYVQPLGFAHAPKIRKMRTPYASPILIDAVYKPLFARKCYQRKIVHRTVLTRRMVSVKWALSLASAKGQMYDSGMKNPVVGVRLFNLEVRLDPVNLPLRIGIRRVNGMVLGMCVWPFIFLWHEKF